MADSLIYRPRGYTSAEMEDAQVKRDQKEFARRMISENERLNARTSAGKLVYSVGKGVAYYDSALGRMRGGKSRKDLDERDYKKRRVVLDDDNFEYGGQRRITSLVDMCRQVIARDYRIVLRDMAPQHRVHLSAILELISKQIVTVNDDAPVELPFEVYFRAATIFGRDDMPLRRRTYRGLALNDAIELDEIQRINQTWLMSWRETAEKNARRSTPLLIGIESPNCFIAMVDFSRLPFTDGQLWTLRSTIASFVVVMRLSYTSVTDEGVSKIVSVFGHEGAYTKLEILILRGCKGITDQSAVGLAKLTALRMIDLKSTNSTSAFRQIINRYTTTSLHPAIGWHGAHGEFDLNESGESAVDKREVELFGGSYSLSTLVSKVHALAPGSPPLTKPLSIYINSIDHVDPVPVIRHRIAQDTLDDELAVLKGQAVKPNTYFSKTYGMITSNRPIPAGILEADAANSDSAYAYRSSNDDIMGGQRNVEPAYRPPPQDDGESDWGEEGEEEKEIIKWRKSRAAASRWGRDVIFGPTARPVIRYALDNSFLTLLRHIPLLSPSLSSSPSPALTASSLMIPLTEGSTLTRKRPITSQQLAALYSPSAFPSKVPRLTTPTNPLRVRTDRPRVLFYRPWSSDTSSVSSSPASFSHQANNASANTSAPDTSASIQRGKLAEVTKEPQRRSALAAFRKR